jgi:hypothetical protein
MSLFLMIYAHVTEDSKFVSMRADFCSCKFEDTVWGPTFGDLFSCNFKDTNLVSILLLIYFV